MTIHKIDNPLSDDGRNKINNNFEQLNKNINKAVEDISNKAFDQVVDKAKLNWKEPVSSSNSLPSNADEGDTRQARDTGKVFRFNGSAWVEIQQIDAGPVNEVDSRLSAELAQKATKEEFNDFVSEVNTQDVPLRLSPLPTFANGVVNCAPFNQDALVSNTLSQYAVWVDENFKVWVGRREHHSSQWIYSNVSDQGVFIFDTVKKDGHYNHSIALDKDGFIHLSGGMHAGSLNYARSDTSGNPGSFTRHSMTGVNESNVSYPRFVRRKDGELLFFYRDGSSPNSDTHVNIYDTATKTWSKLVPKLIDGVATGEGVYLNHIAVDKDGTIHVSGTFRNNGNNDIFYMKSLDGGSTWQKTTGEVYTLPVTHNTLEIAKDIAETKGLLNQNGMEVDDNGNPHIAYFRNDDDTNAYTNIYHLYHNGSEWIEEKITNFKKSFGSNLANHTQELSRPSIITYKNRVFIIYRVNYDGKKGTLRMIEVTNTTYKDFPILNLDLGVWEPSFDTEALYKRGELHMLVVPSTKDINEVDTDLSQLDNWDEQFGGVLSINLKQIDKLIRREVQIPHLRVVLTTTGEKQSISTTGTIALNNGNLISQYGENRLFAKVSIRGRGDVNTTKMTTRLKTTNFDPVIFTIFNSLVFSASSENKSTPFRPLPLKKESVIIESEALIERTDDGSGNISANVDSVTVQVAELIY